jgi:hypothetical protein
MKLAVVRWPFAALFVTLMFAVPTRAGVIAQWAFGGDTGETTMTLGTGSLSGRVNNSSQGILGWEATSFDPNVTANNASLSDSLPPSANDNENYIEDPPTGPLYGFPILRIEPGSNSNDPNEAIQKDKYFLIQVTANDGVALNLSTLEFDAARGGAATPRGYVVMSSVDGYTSIVDQQDVPTVRNVLTHFSIDLSGAQYQGLSTVSFRIYVYTPGGGRSVEFHNVTINGTVQ